MQNTYNYSPLTSTSTGLPKFMQRLSESAPKAKSKKKKVSGGHTGTKPGEKYLSTIPYYKQLVDSYMKPAGEANLAEAELYDIINTDPTSTLKGGQLVPGDYSKDILELILVKDRGLVAELRKDDGHVFDQLLGDLTFNLDNYDIYMKSKKGGAELVPARQPISAFFTLEMFENYIGPLINGIPSPSHSSEYTGAPARLTLADNTHRPPVNTNPGLISSGWDDDDFTTPYAGYAGYAGAASTHKSPRAITKSDDIEEMRKAAKALVSKEKLFKDFFDILKLPSYALKEWKVIEKAVELLKAAGCEDADSDEMGNVYASKGELKAGEHYPCMVAHLDTVHNVDEEIEILVKDNEWIAAVDPKTGQQRGTGGDDKCGVFACIEMARRFPKMKVAMFVGEERGCIGSSNANEEFFTDVGYIIQVDSPEIGDISGRLSGVELFEKDSDFAKVSMDIMKTHLDKGTKFVTHSFTDVGALRRKADCSSLNLSAGYYSYHTDKEVINIDDYRKIIKTNEELIKKLGYKLYPWKRASGAGYGGDKSFQKKQYIAAKKGEPIPEEPKVWASSYGTSSYNKPTVVVNEMEEEYKKLIIFAEEYGIATKEQIEILKKNGMFVELADIAKQINEKNKKFVDEAESKNTEIDKKAGSSRKEIKQSHENFVADYDVQLVLFLLMFLGGRKLVPINREFFLQDKDNGFFGGFVAPESKMLKSFKALAIKYKLGTEKEIEDVRKESMVAYSQLGGIAKRKASGDPEAEKEIQEMGKILEVYDTLAYKLLNQLVDIYNGQMEKVKTTHIHLIEPDILRTVYGLHDYIIKGSHHEEWKQSFAKLVEQLNIMEGKRFLETYSKFSKEEHKRAFVSGIFNRMALMIKSGDLPVKNAGVSKNSKLWPQLISDLKAFLDESDTEDPIELQFQQGTIHPVQWRKFIELLSQFGIMKKKDGEEFQIAAETAVKSLYAQKSSESIEDRIEVNEKYNLIKMRLHSYVQSLEKIKNEASSEKILVPANKRQSLKVWHDEDFEVY